MSRSDRSSDRARIVSATAAVFAATLIAACSSSNTSKDAAGSKTTAGTQTSGSTAGSTAAAPATGSGGGSANDRCPLTAAQVSAVVGVPMTVDSICRYTPTTGKLLPHVLYVKQMTVLITDENAKQIGYTEKLPGVGDAAYIGDTDGMSVLCKSGAHGFEISVDTANATADRASVIKLAKMVVSAFS